MPCSRRRCRTPRGVGFAGSLGVFAIIAVILVGVLIAALALPNYGSGDCRSRGAWSAGDSGGEAAAAVVVDAAGAADEPR
jgi:hypothetical protein